MNLPLAHVKLAQAGKQFSDSVSRQLPVLLGEFLRIYFEVGQFHDDLS